MYRTYRTRDALKTAIRNRLLKPSMRRTTYPVIERYIDDAVDPLADAAWTRETVDFCAAVIKWLMWQDLNFGPSVEVPREIAPETP
jgi:hypothetical protein